VAGFGGLLLITAAAEAGTLLFLNILRNNDASLQAHFLTRNRTLERNRSNIYAALEWQAREIDKQTGTTSACGKRDVRRTSRRAQTCVYQVVQEALNNCAQHALASVVQVCKRQEAGRIIVTVQDVGPQECRG